MIIEFKEHNYIDIDNVTVLRWLNDSRIGIIIVDGQKISILSRDDFDVIEKAFLWEKDYSLYDKNMQKKTRGKNNDHTTSI